MVILDALTGKAAQSLFSRIADQLGFTPWERAAMREAEQITALFDWAESAGEPPYGLRLDVGCGNGIQAVQLAEGGWQVIGAGMLGTARTRSGRSSRRRGAVRPRRGDGASDTRCRLRRPVCIGLRLVPRPEGRAMPGDGAGGQRDCRTRSYDADDRVATRTPRLAAAGCQPCRGRGGLPCVTGALPGSALPSRLNNVDPPCDRFRRDGRARFDRGQRRLTCRGRWR